MRSEEESDEMMIEGKDRTLYRPGSILWPFFIPPDQSALTTGRDLPLAHH